MRRAAGFAVAIAMVVGFAGAPAAATEGPRGTERTFVAGGWEGSPPAVPTYIDPATGNYTVYGHAIWNGSFVGATVFKMTGTVNLTTGDYVATTEAKFVGSYVGDGSTGTLRWHEKMTGNFITGVFVGTIDILRGSGSPTFECSGGHLTWDGYVNPAASYGGYQGTWVHGCPAA